MKSLSNWKLISDRIGSCRNGKNESNNYEYCRIFLITAEDHRFLCHPGVDIVSLIRAIWRTKIHNKREGGSTIAMQLVRTIIGDYTPSIRRKLKEIYYAVKVSSTVEKVEILDSYLSIAYFGWNMHGLEQACNRLGYDLCKLTKFEAASLIARLKYPEPKNYSKLKSEQIRRRTYHILKRHELLNMKGLYGEIFGTERVKEDYKSLS